MPRMVSNALSFFDRSRRCGRIYRHLLYLRRNQNFFIYAPQGLTPAT